MQLAESERLEFSKSLICHLYMLYLYQIESCVSWIASAQLNCSFLNPWHFRNS